MTSVPMAGDEYFAYSLNLSNLFLLGLFGKEL